MALLEIVTVGVLVGRYVYHKLTEKDPVVDREIGIPRTEEGSPIPIVIGRGRVRSPVVAWCGTPQVKFFSDVTPRRYGMNMFLVLGVPIRNGTNRVHRIWAGEYELPQYPAGATFDNSLISTSGPYGGAPLKPLSDLNGNGDCYETGGNFEYAAINRRQVTFDDVEGIETGRMTLGAIQFHNGNASQVLVDPTTLDHKSMASYWMEQDGGIDPSLIPSYRGVMSAFLFDVTDNEFAEWGPVWTTNNAPQVTPYSFEVSSYPTDTYFSGFYGPMTVGDDVNPAHAIAALLCERFEKTGPEILHQGSFAKAAQQLLAEGHGYSRIWEGPPDLRAMIDEILQQIDAVLYEDPATGLFVLKLIRGDYDFNALPIINPSNALVEDIVLTNGSDQPNKIVVKFTERLGGYQDGTVIALDQASAFNTGEREQVLNFPGCHTRAVAEQIAGRKLDARVRPLLGCTATVDRTFWDARPADVVRLTWPDAYLSNRVMRVMRVHRGGATSNSIVLELAEDAVYIHNKKVSTSPLVGPFPTTAEVG